MESSPLCIDLYCLECIYYPNGFDAINGHCLLLADNYTDYHQIHLNNATNITQDVLVMWRVGMRTQSLNFCWVHCLQLRITQFIKIVQMHNVYKEMFAIKY